MSAVAAGDDAATLAVVVSRIDDIREDIAHVRTDVAELRTGFVSRGEWEQRNNYSDSRFASLGREIGDLRTEIRTARAPWWSVAAVLVAGLSLTWAVLSPLL